MKKRPIQTFMILIFTVFFMINASAQENTAIYDLNIELIENKAFIAQTISFENVQQNDFSIVLPKDANILSFYIDQESYDPDVQESEIDKTLRISQECSKIELMYLSKQLLDRAKKSYFTYNLDIPFRTSNISVKLNLPEYAILDNPSSAYPVPNAKTTDGQKITLVWKKQDVKDSFSFFVIFREKTETTILYPLLMAIAIIVVVTYLLLMRKKRKVKKTAVKKAILKKKEPELYLLQSEKSVIDALKENKGEMWQKQIQLKTGFSKAKLSRVVRNLEARGLIKRIPLGNTNKIKLK